MQAKLVCCVVMACQRQLSQQLASTAATFTTIRVFIYQLKKVRQLSDLADESDSCLTLQLAPPSGESCFRINNYMFIICLFFVT
jgi:hypothetical protein